MKKLTVWKTLPIPLTEEKKEAYRVRNAQIDISLQQAKEALDKAKARYKSETESIKKEKDLKVLALRMGFEDEEHEVFERVDELRGIVEFVDEEDNIVYARPLDAFEQYQLRIDFKKPTQTDG